MSVLDGVISGILIHKTKILIEFKKFDEALRLDYTNVQFPVKINDYNKIEKQDNININVFGYENKLKYPIYVSKERFHDHLNLLLITNDDNQHHVLIKDFTILL